jgi:thiol-disulfide isomerase/thioredoxin
MKLSASLLFVLFGVLFSCKNAEDGKMPLTSKPDLPDTSEKKTVNDVYHVNAGELSKNFRSWHSYTYQNIKLEQNFVATDTNSVTITKELFLHRLTSGQFIAIKTGSQNNVPVYQLYKQSPLDPDIQQTMVQLAKTTLALAAMEGKMMPAYHFTDLQGNTYSNHSTKGKVLLIKCWFIGCVACVKEFPVLNKLVEKYKNHNDVQFISLASDPKQKLIRFLAKKPFSYAVIPDTGEYMEEKLMINAYPTHLLIDRKGLIIKASNAIENIVPFLEKEVE